MKSVYKLKGGKLVEENKDSSRPLGLLEYPFDYNGIQSVLEVFRAEIYESFRVRAEMLQKRHTSLL